MICSASCGNWVATRWDRASAVCFIGPQRPSATIENDRSTQRATAADARRSVSTTSKSSTCRATGTPTPARRTARVRVRTTSRGCSSPYSHARDAPVTSPAAPASRRSCGRGRPPARSAKTARSAVLPSRRSAFGLSVRPSSPRCTQPCRRSSRSSSCSRCTSSAACRPSERDDRLDVDVVQRRSGVLLAELVDQARRGRRSPPGRPSPRRTRAAGCRASARPGPS